MVKGCCFYGCTNRSNGEAKQRGVKFYKFPKGIHKRRSWIRSVNRKDWVPTRNSFVCSDHFVGGWHSDDTTDVNYTPTMFEYKEKVATPAAINRTNRAFVRDLSKTFEEAVKLQKEQEEGMLKLSLFHHDYDTNKMIGNETPVLAESTCTGTQCDEDPLLEENIRLKEENRMLKEQINSMKWSINKIKDDDKATKFYTGFRSFSLFLWLYNFLLPKAKSMVYWDGQNTCTERKRPMRSTLPLIDQLLAVLMRLKLGLFVQDVSDRFCIASSTFSNIFVTWMCLMHEELKLINVFPSRDLVRQTTPLSFRSYPNLRIILDCTEIFVQRSSSLVNQNLLFSNYKHHTTFKFLIGITPSGVISFVSDAWGGGRVSDRRLVIESGLLDLLEPGDSVMADKGFTISDLLSERHCTLNTPPFKRSNTQFTVEETFETQKIAKLRIHVERSIGRVKNYHLFDGVMPLSLAPIASKCFKVACWLTNIDVPIV